MEYEISEEDVLLDRATSNPSLLRRQPGDPRPLPARKDAVPELDHQMG